MPLQTCFLFLSASAIAALAADANEPISAGVIAIDDNVADATDFDTSVAIEFPFGHKVLGNIVAEI